MKLIYIKGKRGRQRSIREWEKPIPKNQRRKYSECPICSKGFYYWQYARRHAEENNHWGYYGK